jgi:hypothetical protein
MSGPVALCGWSGCCGGGDRRAAGALGRAAPGAFGSFCRLGLCMSKQTLAKKLEHLG